jgi:tubulin epsilon
MNNIAASVLLNLTSGMRFEGTLNVDLNDITMNMVPFPRHHFLVPSMSPLVVSRAGPSSQRAVDRLFLDVMSREHQLLKCDPRGSTYLACGLLARGRISAADVSRNIVTLRPNMRMAYWNQEV